MKKTNQSAAFADFLSKTYTGDEERAAFERDLAKLVASAKLLKKLEDIREAKQLTKAEVARRLGVKRPVVSRLLTGKGTVPNLGTIADVADALDVYIDMRIKPQPRSGKRHAAIEVL
jgi:predicted XRE-type DNA-binding protein